MTARWPRHAAPDVAGFAADGFTGVLDLVDPDEVIWLRDIVDRLVATRAGLAEGLQQDLVGNGTTVGAASLPQIMAPHTLAPELLGARFLSRAAELGRALLGDDAVTTIAMCIVKPALVGAETPWHQDAAYWDRADTDGRPLRHRAASIWIPLQPAARANGCLEFVAGSHLGGVVAHRHVDDDPDIHAQEVVAEVRAQVIMDPVAVELPAGGASIHDGYLLHRAGPNTTDEARRALILSVRAPAGVG